MSEDDSAPDSSFFHQLLMPTIADSSGIEGDTRMSHCPNVSKLSNACVTALELEMGNGIGHDFKPVVRWDGSLVQDGV